MSTFREDFDPLAVIVDWLDAGRLGKLDALLDLLHGRSIPFSDIDQPDWEHVR